MKLRVGDRVTLYPWGTEEKLFGGAVIEALTPEGAYLRFRDGSGGRTLFPLSTLRVELSELELAVREALDA